MNCLHPFTRKYLDALTGQQKECVCRCGKCVNCLAAFQNEWKIRLTETTRHYGQVIYDTLTFRDDALLWNDVGEDVARYEWDKISHGFSAEFRDPDTPEISEESLDWLKDHNYLVPMVEKKWIQDWLKRGRQQFFRDKGYRPNFKYFICMEYGSKTLRPHFHGLFWGVSYSQYMKYWGNPWKDQFGFTSTRFVNYTPKDTNNVCGYVAKYVTKGEFESPLVRDGLAQKPFRCISKGIGEEFLERTRVFDPLLTEDNQSFTYLSRSRDNYYIQLSMGWKPDLSKITEQEWNRIETYYDESGFAYAMPRYYRYKITKQSDPNLLSYEVQNYLESRNRLRNNQGLQASAATLGIRIPDAYLQSDPSTWGLSSSQIFMISNEYRTLEARKNYSQAERRVTRLKNHYGRKLRNADFNKLL